jgi:hypothetical protein
MDRRGYLARTPGALAEQGLERGSFLARSQIGALQIFDDRQHMRLSRRLIAHDGWNHAPSEPLDSSEATVASDEHVLPGVRADDNRLQQAVRLDTRGQLIKVDGCLAQIMIAGHDVGDRNRADKRHCRQLVRGWVQWPCHRAR